MAKMAGGEIGVADTYVIDLRTRFVDPSIRIWRLIPGEKYHFLSTFAAQGVVFPDLPGLDLPPGPVTEQTPMLDARIMAVRAIKEWLPAQKRHLRDEAEGRQTEAPKAPIRDVAFYAERKLGKDAHTARSTAIGLLGRAARGDLIVVPHRIQDRRISIGEFIDGPEDRVGIKAPALFADEIVPGRRVRWFPAVDEVYVSPELSSSLRRPNAFTLLARHFYEEVFDRSFGTYVFESTIAARFRTASEHFRASHALDLSILTKLAEWATFREEKPTGPLFPPHDGPLSKGALLGSVLSVPIPPRQAVELSLNINSPGTIVLRAASLAPLLFAVIFALSKAIGAADLPDAPALIVTNSLGDGSPNDCTPQVQESARRLLSYMQFDAWKAICDQGTRLGEGPQMTGNASAARLQELSAPTNDAGAGLDTMRGAEAK